MEKEYIETMDDLKKYLNSDEYKSMEKEIMELVKKSEIKNIKYACSFVYDDKDNIIGRVRKEEKR
jgi:putative aminopeptidase FrvX